MSLGFIIACLYRCCIQAHILQVMCPRGGNVMEPDQLHDTNNCKLCQLKPEMASYLAQLWAPYHVSFPSLIAPSLTIVGMNDETLHDLISVVPISTFKYPVKISCPLK